MPLLGLVALQVGRLGVWALVLALVTAAVCVLAVWRYLSAVRLEVGPQEIVRRGVLLTRRWRRDEVDRVLVVDALAQSSITPPFGYVVPLDRAGKRLFQLTSQVWSDDDRERIVALLGRAERIAGAVTAKDLHARYPGALAFAQRRPVLLGMLIALVLIVVTGAITFVVVG